LGGRDPNHNPNNPPAKRGERGGAVCRSQEKKKGHPAMQARKKKKKRDRQETDLLPDGLIVARKEGGKKDRHKEKNAARGKKEYEREFKSRSVREKKKKSCVGMAVVKSQPEKKGSTQV